MVTTLFFLLNKYALVPDQSCPIHPIPETSHSGKSKGWNRDELTLLCDVFTLGGHRGFKHDCASMLVRVFERGEKTTKCDILIEGEKVKQVKEFVYLGTLFTNDGKHHRDIERRVNAENKANEALLAVLAVHNEVLILTLMYYSGSWVWLKKNESRINAVEMQSLHSMCGVSLKDRCRNSDLKDRCRLRKDVVTRVERGKFGDERANENGVCLLLLNQEFNFYATYTKFDHRRIHSYTWRRGEDKSMIVNDRLRSKVVDMRLYRGVNVGTDHFLLSNRETNEHSTHHRTWTIATPAESPMRYRSLRGNMISNEGGSTRWRGGRVIKHPHQQMTLSQLDINAAHAQRRRDADVARVRRELDKILNVES
ncbi:hypothetical protein EVAR_28613_1 [Eumeta japonica]|uniref:Uncharacterized protein n=1 Tax=Eumeta variegata TaxID=151549 RepID=A0A4C1XS20_EUMVA|nr:hypothetical protein EVAR_28613_1 [Eumeta japonica]